MLGKSRIDVGVWVIQSRSLDLSEVVHEAKASQWPLFVHTTSPTGQRSIGTEFRPAETSSLLRRCLLRPRPDLGPGAGLVSLLWLTGKHVPRGHGRRDEP